MNILHVDVSHPLLIDKLTILGHKNDIDVLSSKTKIISKINNYEGLIIRSRFLIDKLFLDRAKNLKFIARVGAGMESIDVEYAQQKGIILITAPEGNRNAVGEHALGMLLSLFNNLNRADKAVRQGLWLREENRGVELDGKIVGIIGYGNMGKAFAEKLKGFNVKVLCYDIKSNVGDENAKQVPLCEFQKDVQILSLHTPETPDTIGIINSNFIKQFNNPFWLINTSRGKSVITEDLTAALQSGQILGAGLDVLEYEKSSFEELFENKKIPDAFQYLIESDKVLLSPHIAGWTIESDRKLAFVIIEKIKTIFH